jgi:uncharacterized integral membrane protein
MFLKDQVQKNLYLSYLIVSLLLAVFTFFINVNIDPVTKEPTAWAFVFIIILIILTPALSGGIMSVTISAHYKSEASVQVLLQEMLPNYWKILRLGLCIYLLSIPAVLVTFLAVFLFLFFPPLAVLAAILLSIGLIALLSYLSVQSSVLVLKDGMKSWQSIKHAFVMLKKAFKKIFLSLLAAFGAYLALSIIFWLAGSLLIIAIYMVFGFSDSHPVILWIASLVAQLTITFPSLFALSVYVKRYKDKIEPEFNPAD